MASLFCRSRSYASTARRPPDRIFFVIWGRWSSAIVKITAMGCNWVMTARPPASLAWTMLPASTRRRPILPLIGAVILL